MREKLEAVKHQLLTGTFSDTKLTVKAYLEQWLKEKERSVKERTAMLYREQADRYVIPKIGRIRLDKLTPMHLQHMRKPC